MHGSGIALGILTIILIGFVVPFVQNCTLCAMPTIMHGGPCAKTQTVATPAAYERLVYCDSHAAEWGNHGYCYGFDKCIDNYKPCRLMWFVWCIWR